MSIVVCAATGSEHSACLRGIRDAKLSSDFEVLRTGMGFENAGRVLREYLKTSARPSLIVSSGFAGGFSPILTRNSWVTADTVLLAGNEAIDKSYRAVPLAGIADVVSCTMVSSAELVIGAGGSGGSNGADKAQQYLALPQPVAVDMESAVLAQVAVERGIPIMIFRMITDTPAEPLPDFLAPLTGAIISQGARIRAALAFKGLAAAVRDTRGIARLVKDGSSWPKLLRRGWSQNAAVIREIGLNEIVRKS